MSRKKRKTPKPVQPEALDRELINEIDGRMLDYTCRVCRIPCGFFADMTLEDVATSMLLSSLAGKRIREGKQ